MDRQEFLRCLPGLMTNYSPADDVVQQLKLLRLLLVVGPSGVGKTTLINKSGLTYVPSDNSRLPRPGEKEGVDFYFRQDYQTVIDEIRQGKFVQVVVDSGGDLKATRASAYPTGGQVVMAVMSDVVPQFRQLGFASTLTAFITPPNYEDWITRLNHHHLDKSQLKKRLSEAQRSFEFGLQDSQTHMVLNDDLQSAVKQLKDLLNGRSDKGREAAARQAAKDILKQLEGLS